LFAYECLSVCLHYKVSDGCVSLATSCDLNISNRSSSSSSSRRRRRRRTTTTTAEEFDYFGTELFACDQVHVEVVGVSEIEHGTGESIEYTQIHLEDRQFEGDVRCAVDQGVDEGSADQHDGRHGGVGRG